MLDSNRVERQELFEHILAALEEMPTCLREAFVLRHYQARSEAAIARTLRLEKEEVASRVCRARKTLHQKLAMSAGRLKR